MLFPMLGREFLQFGTITKHTLEWEIDERNLKIINLTIFILKRYKIGERNNSSVNIRYAAKTSDISLKTSEVATLMHVIHVCTLQRSHLCDV